jgi:hypothetical protein
MRRIIVSLLIGGLLGGGAGFVAGIFFYPYIFLADIVATEDIGDVSARQLVATGTFIHADPDDPIHHGSGGVTVYADAVHLQDDFEVGPGPAFHVYLAPQQEVTPDTEAARLQGQPGLQNPGGCGSAALPERDCLVPAFRGVDFACQARVFVVG